MQINKLYISLKHWPALPSPGLAGHGPSVAPLALPSSPRLFLFGKKSFRRLFRLKSFRRASAISHSQNMQPKIP